eukprot:jgi/Bigna1/125304/aug1.1_g12
MENVHDVAGVLKLYIRSLKEPIIASSLYDEFIKLDTLKKKAQKFERYLCRFLQTIARFDFKTKMTAFNLAVIFAPSILKPLSDDPAVAMADMPKAIRCMSWFIEHAFKLFPEEEEEEEEEEEAQKQGIQKDQDAKANTNVRAYEQRKTETEDGSDNEKMAGKIVSGLNKGGIGRENGEENRIEYDERGDCKQTVVTSSPPPPPPLSVSSSRGNSSSSSSCNSNAPRLVKRKKNSLRLSGLKIKPFAKSLSSTIEQDYFSINPTHKDADLFMKHLTRGGGGGEGGPPECKVEILSSSVASTADMSAASVTPPPPPMPLGLGR